MLTNAERNALAATITQHAWNHTCVVQRRVVTEDVTTGEVSVQWADAEETPCSLVTRVKSAGDADVEETLVRLPLAFSDLQADSRVTVYPAADTSGLPARTLVVRSLPRIGVASVHYLVADVGEDYNEYTA